MALCIFVIHCKPPFITNIPMLVPFQIHFKMSSLTGGYISSNLWLYSLSVKSQGHEVCLIDLKLSVHPFSSNVADALATFKSDHSDNRSRDFETSRDLAKDLGPHGEQRPRISWLTSFQYVQKALRRGVTSARCLKESVWLPWRDHKWRLVPISFKFSMWVNC